MNAQEPEPVMADRPAGGLFQSLTRLVATLVGLAQTRLELLTTELQEEIQRAAELLLWTFVALLAAGTGVIFVGATIIIAFWDGPRLLAAILVTLAFLAIAAIALFIVRGKLRRKTRLLEATRAELARDRADLEAQL